MKKYFGAGLVIVLLLSLSVILYGAYLNERGEYQIAQRMEERRVELIGVKASMRNLKPQMKFGAVNLYSPNVADAVALIDGRIVSSLAARNSYVRAGDLLFVLQNENIALSLQEAEAGILSAEAELQRTGNNFDRYRRLREREAASIQQFDEAQSAYTAAQANLQAAVAKRDKLLVEESRSEVRSPIDGVVRIIYRQPGTYVQGGTALALIGDYQELYFSEDVPDDKAQLLQVGQEAEFVFPAKEFWNRNDMSAEPEAGGGEHAFAAVLSEISPPLDTPADMRTMLWKISNHNGLLSPQTYGTAYLKLIDAHKALCVPLAALDKSRRAVFVYHDGQIEKRAVTTKRNDGTFVEIASGLAAGDIVITSGTDNLTDGMKATVSLTEGEENGQNACE